MVGGLQGQSSKPTILCVCMLMWATRGCAGFYFYAYDYSSWLNTVMIFRNTSILRDGGVLQMNPYMNATIGRALYKTTFQMQNSTNGSLASFNTSFVFAMSTDRAKEFFGDGFAFFICPNPFRGSDLQVSSGGYLGMFNSSTTGQLRNKVFAVEFDTHRNLPFKDPNDNHIGVDVNSVISLKTNNLTSLGITLNGGRKIVCWIDYDGTKRYLWVYLAYSPSEKPSSPAISMDLNLAPYMKDYMYVGFSSATGTRAELHTIYSWWFLSGFGNLTLPLSPPSSHGPLASLGKRSIVITIFTLAVALGFLCCFCVLARWRWQEQSKHLIDIFLPVACWMYWKENITEEVRSTCCLKLATPTVELLAWLWRTRWPMRHDHPVVKTWQEMLLKRKMRPHCREEAWQLENKRRKRGKRHSALHVIVYEEPIEEDSSGDEGDRVKVIKHIKVMPVPDMEVKEAAEMEEEAPTPLIVPATGKSYKVESNLVMIVEEENKARLFQRRGSFSIPQCAPDDKCRHELEQTKEKDAAGPVVAPPGVEQKTDTSKVKVGAVSRHARLQSDTVWISTKEKLFQRRGSFSVHPEDTIEFSGVEAAKESKGEKSGVRYIVENDVKGRSVDARRGSFSVHPEDAIEFTGRQASKEGKDQQRHAGYIVEHDAMSNGVKGLDVRKGYFMLVEEAGSSTSTVRPGPSDQTLQSSERPTPDRPPKSLPHHISNTNEGGKSHVTHRWLFD